MAIVHSPALSLAASGCVGGINYTRWRGRSVARVRNPCVQTSTPDQLVCRGYMTALSQAWGTTMTAAQRQAWSDAAAQVRYPDRLGTKRNPNGYNLYLKWNLQRLNYGYALPEYEPLRRYIPAWKDCLVVYAPSYPRVQLFLRTLISGDVYDGWDVWRTPGWTSAGRNPIDPDWRLIGQKKTAGAYNDYTVGFSNWYWYRCRFFTSSGEVGGFITSHVFTTQPV